MTVIASRRDAEARTLTIDAAFDAPVERVWQLLEDPRQLERWWGPPTYPATFKEHDLTVGGRSHYWMTSPEGEQHHAWWHIVAVDPPNEVTFEEGFADETGTPNPDMPTMVMRARLDDAPGGGTNMTILSTFATAADMEQMMAMGMEEGLTGAMGQMDDLLTAPAST